MQLVTRGATVFFSTTFFDNSGNVVTPPAAQLHLTYTTPNGSGSATIEMTPPTVPSTLWTAEWDSRGASPGGVAWSIHSEGPTIPYAVEDGQFLLTANDANLLTF